MAWQVYPAFKGELAIALQNWTSGAFEYRLSLLTAGGFNAAHTSWNDLVANEATAAGYAAKTLNTRTVAVSGNDRQLKCEDLSWASITGAGGTMTAAVVYKYTSGDTPSQSELVAFETISPSVVANGLFEFFFAGGVFLTLQ